MDKFLDMTNLESDPFKQFSNWFKEATANENVYQAEAMVLATVSKDNIASQRIVLLKSFSERGFVFFTNYQSAKATDIASNKHVTILFPWLILERQVIIGGIVEKISHTESIEYFKTRPRGSKIGAWASMQSQVITNREQLLKLNQEYEVKFKTQDVEMPPNWGGYIVKAHRFEFWQGRESRLHDRLQYVKNDSLWKINRLSP